MNQDDQEILKEVQKNTRMAVKAIETISEKLHDERLNSELIRENVRYSTFHNKAVDA